MKTINLCFHVTSNLSSYAELPDSYRTAVLVEIWHGPVVNVHVPISSISVVIVT